MIHEVSQKPKRQKLTFALSVNVKVSFILDGIKGFINAMRKKLKDFILTLLSSR